MHSFLTFYNVQQLLESSAHLLKLNQYVSIYWVYMTQYLQQDIYIYMYIYIHKRNECYTEEKGYHQIHHKDIHYIL